MASEFVFDTEDANFEADVFQSDVPVVVDFWAPWCGPCRQIAPVLDELADKHGGDFKVAKVNVDNNQESARRFSVQAIPTILGVKNGEVVGQLVGFAGRRQLEQFVDNLTSG